MSLAGGSSTRARKPAAVVPCRVALLLAVLCAALCARTPAVAQTAAARTPHPEVVVSVDWLQQALARDGPRPVLLNASWSEDGVAREYLSGHLPGAIHLDTDRLETGYPRWALRSLPELHGVIGELGIGPADTVVVYGDKSIAAARAWWVLMYAGVHDVRYLDGGLRAWRAAGLPVETAAHTPVPREFSAVPRQDFIIGTAELRRRLDERGMQLADTRGWAEYNGLLSGYDYAAFAGRIPHAIAAGNADDSATIYQDASGHLRDPQEVLSRWHAAGLRPESRELIFYCGTGWRSSLAFLYAYALGLPRIRNYSEGWLGWSTLHEADATATGPTPGWRQIPSDNPVESPIPAFLRRR